MYSYYLFDDEFDFNSEGRFEDDRFSLKTRMKVCVNNLWQSLQLSQKIFVTPIMSREYLEYYAHL